MTNFEEIKREYVNGMGNLRDLAAKHGVAYETLRRRAAKGNWRALRDTSRSEGAVLERQLRVADSMLDIAEKELDQFEQTSPFDMNRFCRLINAVKGIFSIQHSVIRAQREAADKPEKCSDDDSTDASPMGFSE